MNTISFKNKGLIDLRAVRTFGVSAKDCNNPIEFFGTGLKYAISICLRLGCKIVLFRGLERFEFSTAGVAIRNSEFRIVKMNDEEIGFTTDLGKTWEAWQAFRELYCNTIDEGGTVVDSEVEPMIDHTTIVVTGQVFHAAFLDRDQIVLKAAPRWTTPKVQLHERHCHFGYYRGIRVTQLPQHAALTYNVISNLDLTEDRTLKNPYYFNSMVRDAILTSDDRELISSFLQAPDGSFESKVDLDSWTEPSEVFLQTLEQVSFKRCTNSTALRVYKKNRKCEIAPDSKPLNKIEEKQLQRAVQFCEWAGYPVRDFETVVTADLADNIWGRAYENRIYINRSAFMAGTKIVAGTLIEEYIHLRYKLSDESRELQNHLLNALVSMGEIAMGEPI